MELESWSKSIPSALRHIALRRPPKAGVIPLRELRSTVVGLGMRLLLIAVFLLVRRLDDPEPSALGWVVFVVGGLVGVSGVVVTRRYLTAGLLAAANGEAADRIFSQRMMLGSVIAQSIALIGLVVAFLHSEMLTYWIGLPVSLALHAWVSPRSGDIGSLQDQLAAQGSAVDLVEALTTPRSWSARGETKRKRRTRT